MKIKDLIKQLEKLDKEKNIFLKNFMMCNNFEIHKVSNEDINWWNKWIDIDNVGDYYIIENEDWLNENSK